MISIRRADLNEKKNMRIKSWNCDDVVLEIHFVLKISVTTGVRSYGLVG